jgi:hypothetical protein
VGTSLLLTTESTEDTEKNRGDAIGSAGVTLSEGGVAEEGRPVEKEKEKEKE